MARSSGVTLLLTLGFAPLEGFQSIADFSRSVRTLTQKVSPAVVQVLVSGYGASSEGEGQEVSLLSRQRSSASGVIVDSGGYIITNAHVIRGAVNVRVLMASIKTPDSDAPVDAKVVGVDRGTDLALLKVDRTALPTLPFGETPEVGIEGFAAARFALNTVPLGFWNDG